jgi:hypothetical protein
MGLLVKIPFIKMAQLLEWGLFKGGGGGILRTGVLVALRGKLADLGDNLDASRIEHPSEQDVRRMERYRAAREILEVLAAKGCRVRTVAE